MTSQDNLRQRSSVLVDGPNRAAARSQLYSVGFDDEALSKPLVMVAHNWIGTMPCNFSHRELAQDVMRGIREAGGTPMEVNTVSISDGITMGTEGMKASLISREIITDSIELCAVGYAFDAAVVICGCDKTIPAAAMAMARINIPSVALYSGSIAPDATTTVATSPSRTSSRPSASTRPAPSTTTNCTRSRSTPAPAPAPAALSTPPTPWPPRSNSLASRRWAQPPSGRPTRASTTSARPPDSSSWTSSGAASSPATSSPAKPSRTASPAPPRPAVRPTSSSTCSPSPARPASNSASTTSTRSPSAPR